jgi:hypothetical protein
LAEDAMGARAYWADWVGRRPGRGSGLARPIEPAGLDSREGFKFEIDSEFQMNLEFGKTLRNFTRRFRRNLNMRIFLNSSRLLKDFQKNKICHAMICNLSPN